MLCVIAKIDEDSRQKLNTLCRCAEEYGASPKNLYGHITLDTYLDVDENASIVFSFCSKNSEYRIFKGNGQWIRDR